MIFSGLPWGRPLFLLTPRAVSWGRCLESREDTFYEDDFSGYKEKPPNQRQGGDIPVYRLCTRSAVLVFFIDEKILVCVRSSRWEVNRLS